MSGCTAIVPTLGWSDWLADSLAALRRSGDLELVVVWQGNEPPPALDADRILSPGANLGFSGAVNFAIAHGTKPLVALVNDDAIVAPGWLEALLGAMADAPSVAAVQGVVLTAGTPARVDGCGIAWNGWWQAVQAGHGGEPPLAGERPGEVFGVSATAAIYRREDLDEACWRPGEWLDARLFAYYEDVDLACRLRARGSVALCVPAARVRHAGSRTGDRLGSRRWRWIHAHRLLVLSRLLGRSLWALLPRLLARDLADALSPANRPRPAMLPSLVTLASAWARAARLLPRFARRGAPLVPLAELERFRVGSAGWLHPS